MNLKLTGLREVLGGPSDPGGFVHNFISEKKNPPDAKKSVLRLKNGRIFSFSLSLKMVQKCISLRIRGANAFYVSDGVAFLFYGLSGYSNTFQKLVFFWGGGKNRF